MRPLDDLPVKLASLALAVLLWFVIAGEKTSERGVSVPVELQNVPKDLELTGDAVNTVDVRLRASPGIIQQLGPGEVSAQVDLKGAAEGEHIVHLTDSTIRVPFGVKVVKVTPAILRLSFERTLTKRVPIRPRVTGRPAAGYELAELLAEPTEVAIAGPKSRVQDTESAFTEPVSVEGATRTLTEQVSLGLEDPGLRIEGNPRALVTARIRELHVKRRFTLALELREGSGALRPASVEVTVSGPASAVARLVPAELHAVVRAEAGATGPLPVTVELPSGVADLRVESVVPPRASLRPAPRKRS
jgi:YbbR domain-containing protein